MYVVLRLSATRSVSAPRITGYMHSISLGIGSCLASLIPFIRVYFVGEGKLESMIYRLL